MARLSSFEHWWHNSWPHRLYLRCLVPRFLRACPEPFRGVVLEVGSGSGWSSRRILETFPQVELTASDIDPRTGKNFTKLMSVYGQRLKFYQADLMKLPFDREAFDIVVAINVLHYASDIREALIQLIRVLRPGGLLGLSDTNLRKILGLNHFFPYPTGTSTLAGLQSLLAEEGCDILKTHGNSHYYIWARKPHPVNTIANTMTY